MRSRRSWWSIYAACAVVVTLALVWITVAFVRLERAEVAARSDAQYQESLRLALWRMDSWISPQLAREAARPYVDYQPFYVQEAYSNLKDQVESDEVFTPSPLLTFRSDFFRLHFQLSPEGEVTSPQVPVGQLRGLAEEKYLNAAQIEANAAILSSVGSLLTTANLNACLNEAEEERVSFYRREIERRPAAGKYEAKSADKLVADIDEKPANEPMANADEEGNQALRSSQEFAKRKSSALGNLSAAPQSVQVLEAADEITTNDRRQDSDSDGFKEGFTQTRGGRLRPSDAPTVVVGSLLPTWVGGVGPGKEELIFFRRVLVDGRAYFQGFLCDWTRLDQALLGQIHDLFDETQLRPVRSSVASEPELGKLLATIPVSLQAAIDIPAIPMGPSPTRMTLLIGWFAVLAGLVAVAVTLRSVIAYGDKRSRFASAVTHELRTPLTTFRMYTEMLSEDMVQDEEKRRAYITTLKEESGRLATLVENVLSYAQLEEGRWPARIEAVSVEGLLAGVMPPLERRAEEVGMALQMNRKAGRDTMLRTDVNAVGQILFNLVDNACKYAGEVEDRSIQVEVSAGDGTLRIRVRDHGAGVSAKQARLIFTPFERGGNHASAKPGIGLGLALSRGLARDLGGDLTLDASCEGGACFELTLPLRS